MKKLLAIITAFSACLALAACSSPASSSDVSSVESEQSVSSEIVQSSETQADTANWPRTIIDAKGAEIVLEEKPEAITLLHGFYLEHLLALGEMPTAAAVGNAYGQAEALRDSELFGPHLENSEIIDLGSTMEINPEAVLETNPDLILSFNTPTYDEIYDQLTAIAPVVLLDYTETWDEQLRSVANLVGKENEVDTIISDIQAEIDEPKRVLATHTDETVAIFRTDGKGFIAIAQAPYYEAFGLTIPNNWPADYAPISLEAVVEMNPTYIVFQHNYDASVAFVESMETMDAWNNLDAVKNGEVYYFDENLNSFGPLAIELSALKISEIFLE